MDDDYIVKLPNGDARVMSIDELDAAFDAGTIREDSPVLAPGTVTWTTLGVLAGLDEACTQACSPPSPPAFEPSSPSSMAPMVFTPRSDGNVELDIPLDIPLADDEGASFAPRRRAGKVIGVLFGAVAVLAVGFAIKSAIGQALATRAGEAALAAQASTQPPAPAPVPPPAPSPSPTVAAAAAAPAAAPAPASSKGAAVAAKEKDKDKKGKLPGAPASKRKKS